MIKLRKLHALFLALLFISAIFFTVELIKKYGYALTYAVTVSMPQGWYLIVPAQKIARYDIVQFKPPTLALNFLHKEHLIPNSDLLLKYAVGLPGDFVCNKNDVITVNQKKFSTVYRFDTKGVRLPQISFCGKLGRDQYLLLSDNVKNSFDGRYFGPVCKTIETPNLGVFPSGVSTKCDGHIIGKAIPLLYPTRS